MERILFSKNKLPFGWCSNMSPYEIKFGDKVWRTTEALFQALRFTDEDIIEAIRAEKSPMAAKFVAKGNVDKMVIEQLGEKDLMNMKMCLKLKTTQHPQLLTELMGTGDGIITEDVTSRGDKGSNLFWGAMLTPEGWVGKNTLGNMWMEHRDSLKVKI